jgi:hypothetical protein
MRRVPEIVLGFLLATAIWAVALVILPIQIAEHKPSDNQTEKSDAKYSKLYEFWEWATHDAITVYTFFVAAFTFSLFIISTRADRTNRIIAKAALKSANAADLHAKAAIGAELPIVLVQKFEVIGDPFEGEVVINGDRLNYPTLRCSIINYGRTPAELESYLLDYRFTKRLADVPEYDDNLVHPLTPGTMLLPQGDPGAEMAIDRKFTLNQQLRDALTNEDVFMWVYGYVRCRDFLSDDETRFHETRFVAMALIGSKRPIQWFRTIYGNQLGDWFNFVYGSNTPPAYNQRT